jgi:CRP/FNR family transcriptional regulator, cyclic AMP receptor protein
MRASGSEDSSLNWFAGSKPASALSVGLMKRFTGARRTSPFLTHHQIATRLEDWRNCSGAAREFALSMNGPGLQKAPMDDDNDAPGYLVWAVDNVVYGPVKFPTLVQWAQEERVTASTWIHLQAHNRWELAGQIPDLLPFLATTAGNVPSGVQSPGDDDDSLPIKPGTLRRVKILANLGDAELEQFLALMQLQRARQREEIVREGSPGDAMYLLLEGEVRVRLLIGGQEAILATLSTGEFFGEVALFDHGPRSADVVANTDCLLLKIATGSFQRLIQELPHLAAPFLYAMGRTLIARIRADNKRYRDSIAFARTASQFHKPA